MYKTTTEFNCGIDLHARCMYACVVDRDGNVLVHKNIKGNDFEYFLKLVEPYRHDLTVCCECTFNWYWLADACEDAGVEFVLAHALYLRAIHELDRQIERLERLIMASAKKNHWRDLHVLLSVPGIGKVLAMTILFEIGDIARFPRHQDLASYARLVRGTVASAGKIEGMRGAKMGNGYLKWAFKEAVLVAKRAHPEIRAMYQRLERKHDKATANAILAHRLARAIYYMLSNGMTFSMDLFSKRLRKAA